MEQYKIDLAKYRLEKAMEHLSSAKDLLRNGHLRDSISRSYYAIFTTARAILALEELDSKKHSGVIALFNQHFVKIGILSITASKIIQEARSYREKADYEDFFIITQEEAEKQFENATNFIHEVEKKISELVREDKEQG